MAAIRIDADALFRAVTATGYKLLAYHLNPETGEVISRTLRPDEVAAAPQGPSVKPLPKLGGDLTPKKDATPFGPPPVSAPKKKLFSDDDLPKKPAFNDGFWKRDESKKLNPFGEDFKRESGTKKLAEIFSGGSPLPRGERAETSSSESGVRGRGTPAPAPSSGAEAPPSPHGGEGLPRIPVASEEQQKEWMQQFAKDSGDPQIREQLLKALHSAKPLAGFERVLRGYQRTGQQWERYFRKRALACAEAWLETLGVEWELVEK